VATVAPPAPARAAPTGRAAPAAPGAPGAAPAPPANVASTLKRVKTKTLEGLKAARMKPARPTYFMLCIGNKGAMAYLAPVVGPSHKTLLRPLMGKDTGLKYHRGQCVYDKGYYTFVGPTVATGMKRKIELGLFALTGRRFRATARRGAVQETKQKSSAELPA
jgi:hypothetical protein